MPTLTGRRWPRLKRGGMVLRVAVGLNLGTDSASPGSSSASARSARKRQSARRRPAGHRRVVRLSSKSRAFGKHWWTMERPLTAETRLESGSGTSAPRYQRGLSFLGVRARAR